MGVLELYNETRARFPAITARADEEHIRRWDEIEPEFAYSWFESLANALNTQMEQGVDPEEHQALFDFLSSKFDVGDEHVKDCIDVSFTENLFWRVASSKAKPYWLCLSANLKELYVRFHGKTPI